MTKLLTCLGCTLVGVAILAKSASAGQREVCEIVMEVFDTEKLVVQHFIDKEGPVYNMRRCIEDYPRAALSYLTIVEATQNKSKERTFNDDYTGIVILPSNSSQVTVSKMNYISFNYYTWATIFCNFHNISKVPPLFWLARCCDVCIFTDGMVNIEEEHIIYERRSSQYHLLVFSTGKTDVACGKCGLVRKFDSLTRAITKPTMFNKSLLLVSHNKPWYFAIDFDTPTTGTAHNGFEFMLMRDISEHLGFRYNVVTIPGDKTWGTAVNGSFVGLLSKLVSRQAHFAVGDLSVLDPRNLYMDYTYPHDFDVLTFVSKVRVKKLSSMSLYHLLDSQSWLSIMVLAVVTCCVLLAATKLYRIQKAAPVVFFTGIEYIFGTLVQPSVNIPYFSEGPINHMFMCWSVGMFILYCALSGELVTLITSPGFEGVVNSLKEWLQLLRRNPSAPVCVDESNFLNFFDPQNDALVDPLGADIGRYAYRACFSWTGERITNEIVLERSGFWVGEGVEIAAEFIKAARTHNGSTAGTAMAHVAPGLNIMHQGMFLQRSCAYTSELSMNTRRMFETGHIIHFKKIMNMYEMPPLVVTRNVNQLSLSNIGGIVTVILVAECCMIGVLLIELCWALVVRLKANRMMKQGIRMSRHHRGHRTHGVGGTRGVSNIFQESKSHSNGMCYPRRARLIFPQHAGSYAFRSPIYESWPSPSWKAWPTDVPGNPLKSLTAGFWEAYESAVRANVNNHKRAKEFHS